VRPTRPPFTDTAIRNVLDQRAVRCVYQPVVNLRTQEIFAYEALARSKSPDFDGPISLFAAAVEHSCAGELGRMLREMAIEEVPNEKLFVNIHPAELNEKWLVQPNDPIFQHTQELYLEITESIPLSHFHLCQSILAEVRDRGVHLVVDDLGAGYSNLKYIADLHPRVVKLDRGLIAGLRIGTRLFKLVSAIVVLCRELGAMVVAEGIETVDELKAVIAAGAHYGQGYLLARPAFPPPEEVNWPAEMTDEDDVTGPVSSTRKRSGTTPPKSRTSTKSRKR
jgi:EAL domain-containing protein (putative c-di-GMP-specific phosphodiesterase class I)